MKQLKCVSDSLKNLAKLFLLNLNKKLIRFLIILVLACFLTQRAITHENHRNPKVNVLFIAVDDLKPILGCYGDEKVQSPNIDQLANTGVVFSNNHCQQAVCAPSRASLLTGLRPDETEVWDLKTYIRDQNPDALTLLQYFKQNGYETAAVGKVFDPRSVDAGHDSASWTIPYSKITGGRWIDASEKVSTESADAPEETFVDGKIAARGSELLTQLSAGGKPFFLAVGFKKPHLPFVAPKKYWDIYKRDSISVHPFQEHAKYSPGFAYHNSGELRNNYVDIPKEGPIPEEKQKELIHGYYACVSFIDAQVGKLLAQLDSSGVRENTVVVLWGDHGWHLGDHAMWAKHSNFEQATRSPMIFSVPGMTGGTISDSPTEFVDIFPTLCNLAGLEIPAHLAGKSLVPVLQDPEVNVKPFAMSQYKRTGDGKQLEGYALRTKRYRYVEWIPREYKYGDQPYDENDVVAHELYDYQTDPLETVSVVDSLDYQGVVDTLRQYMKEFLLKNYASIDESHGNIIVPQRFELKQNYPNPFNSATAISYRLAAVSEVELAIYNLLGQKLTTLVNQQQPQGEYVVPWNGFDNSNNRMASGVYYYRLESGAEKITRKMVLIQ